MSTRPFTLKSRSLADLWFPVALVLLLLLTIPAAILLVLKLLGREAQVNGWLQENLRISYQVALPGWAAVVLLLVPFLLVLLYFLKMRRQPLQVPSTFLWRKSVEDLHVNSLFQWLRKNLLLLLQLACILLLIFAVMAFKVFGSGGTHYVIILDSSASMSVADVEPNRLEVAKRLALEEIDRHTDNDSGMVIEFNGRAAVRQGYTTDRGLLRQAVRDVQPTQQPTRVEEALRQAESLANPQRSAEDAKVRPPDEDPGRARTYVPPEGIKAEVHLYTDGCFSQNEAEALNRFTAGNLDISYHRVGRPGAENVDNVGLTSFSAAIDRSGANRLRVSARVQNFRRDPTTVKVELTTRIWGKADFKLADRVLNLSGRKLFAGEAGQSDLDRDEPGDGLADFVVPAPKDGARLLLHARLLDARDGSPHRDQFPLDDQAWLLVGGIRKAHVLIVTQGNEALEWFFNADGTKTIAEVDYLNPTDPDYAAKYRRVLSEIAVDLVIFDRASPPAQKEGEASSMPLANTFFIDQLPAPLGLLKDADKDKRLIRPIPKILNPSHRHPLMRGLTGLDEIVFTRPFRFDLDPDQYPNVPRLLETEKEGALLFALPRGGYTDLVLTAPLVMEGGKHASNWPVMVGFPVFLGNVLQVLGHVRETPTDETVQPGQLKTIRPEVVVAAVQVLAPGTDQWQPVERGSDSGEFSYIAEQVGVHRARWQEGDKTGEQPFVVNLLDNDESNIQPRDVIALGDQKLSAVKSPPTTVDTWKWGALIAVVLLAIEWWLYHRRFFN